MNDISGFRKEDFPLLPVKLEQCGGFMWVNLDPQSEPLKQYLGDFVGLLKTSEELRWVNQIGVYDAACNWKVAMENFVECYHCPFVHPQYNCKLSQTHSA